jgi:hypothetical protein
MNVSAQTTIFLPLDADLSEDQGVHGLEVRRIGEQREVDFLARRRGDILRHAQMVPARAPKKKKKRKKAKKSKSVRQNPTSLYFLSQ